jgi:hypothetical protein
MKDKKKKLKIFTPDFNVALIVTILFAVGTYLMIPPFSWVLNLGDSIKDRGAVKYGEPPYGHAELSSLKTFTQKMNLDLDRSKKLLEQAGYVAENENVTLAALGKKHGATPQQIYFIIKDAENKPAENGETGTNQFSIPDDPPPGTGNLTLADFCARYSMSLKAVLRELKKQEINASEAQTLKTIAAEKGIGPTDLYYMLWDIAKLG